MSRAPARTMPWIELVADISGVCSVAGTLPMTSMPTSSASMKMVRSVSSAVDIGTFLGVRIGGQQGGHALVHDPAAVRDDHAGLDFVAGVDGQHAAGSHVLEQRGDVP